MDIFIRPIDAYVLRLAIGKSLTRSSNKNLLQIMQAIEGLSNARIFIAHTKRNALMEPTINCNKYNHNKY